MSHLSLLPLFPDHMTILQGDRRVKVQYTPGKETRKGLGPLLVGLLYALAEVVFGITEITIAPVKVRADPEDGAQFKSTPSQSLPIPFHIRIACFSKNPR